MLNEFLTNWILRLKLSPASKFNRIDWVFLKSKAVLRVWSYPLFWVGAANSNSLFCVPLFFAIKENHGAWAILDKENPNRYYLYNQMQSYAWYFTLSCLNLTVVYICFWVWWCNGCCGAQQRHQVLKRCLLTNFEEVKVDTGHLLCETTKILALVLPKLSKSVGYTKWQQFMIVHISIQRFCAKSISWKPTTIIVIPL